VEETLGTILPITWRYFPLEQVNSDKGDDWKLWEQPAGHRSRGRAAFQAAIAATKQGDEAYRRFHLSLLRAKHERGLDHGRRQTLMEVAGEAELDLAAFEKDLEDRSQLGLIGADYERGRRLGAFGTPTLVFAPDAAFYLKLQPKELVDQPVELFESIVKSAIERPYLLELKRPTKPSANGT